MKTEIDTNRHFPVGPITDVYDHGPVTIIGPATQQDQHPKDSDSGTLAVCLDCGYVVGDVRSLRHEECDRSKNTINQTWRERLEERGVADALGGQEGSE